MAGSVRFHLSTKESTKRIDFFRESPIRMNVIGDEVFPLILAADGNEPSNHLQVQIIQASL